MHRGHGRKKESSIRASFNSLVTSYDITHSVISLLWHLLGVLQSQVFLFCISHTIFWVYWCYCVGCTGGVFAFG
jgi:hypothetical protein